MTTRHHNRPLTTRPVHARLARKMRRMVHTFDNAAHAAHWLVWTANRWGGSR